MNPLTNMKNVLKLSEQDLKFGGTNSWHDQYRHSAWIFVGGLPYDLTEGDVICIFSQYGEVVNVNLVRDKSTGKQKGFCFLCYEDQRSTVLAVDNLNGVSVLGRKLRVDHVEDYKPPKENEHTDEETKRLRMEGCAPREQLPLDAIKKERIEAGPGPGMAADGFRLPPRLPIKHTVKSEPRDEDVRRSKGPASPDTKRKKSTKERR